MFTYDFPRPAVTVDLVTFCLAEGELRVLLIRRNEPPFSGTWTLPGGFVHEREPLQTTAMRVLRSKALLDDVYLEQLATFGDPERDPRDHVISVAYFVILPLGFDYGGPGHWFNVDSLPDMGFDHRNIARVALERLRGKLTYTDIGFRFMRPEFTLGELQQSWETVLGTSLDKRNFRKAMLKQVHDTGKKSTGGAHPPAKIFRRGSPSK